ncbi:uncharacterized protein LOC132057860 [Lycium ferocissimum]|uniref:uncharacterized protein LOC132057860 n=1 Tax=Lycium ferocissimum TaxID=112874 RepID=UPI00281651D2|nr:uncharacterized protein LOC132057860 [Lycium ferocissimum]
MVGGDFNVVLNQEEKIGGLPVDMNNAEDFAFCINSYELEVVNFKGSPFTWWNGRAADECIFERLDTMLVNSQFLNWFGQIEVEHLARTVSDHAPLLCTYGEVSTNVPRPFNLKGVLSRWSREACGDIFKQLIIREEIVKIKEELFEEIPSTSNRCEYWRQKASVDWFAEGDRNTRFFHNLVKGRRKKLLINRIQGSDSVWLEDEVQIAAEAVKFYQTQF